MSHFSCTLAQSEVGSGAWVALFARPRDAVALALELHHLAGDRQTADSALCTAIATGYARIRSGIAEGDAVYRSLQLALLAHPGQILLCESTARSAGPDLPPETDLSNLGLNRFQDLIGAETVFQVVHPGLPAAFPALRSPSACPNNLPAQFTRFVGRERESAQLGRLLSEHRLVTLTGAGGAGKTRLAVQTAAAIAGRYPDGVWLVELAALAEGELVPEAVASAVGLHLASPQRAGQQAPLAALVEHLGNLQTLLLLDNCEHLRYAVSEVVAALLRACPKLQVLVTSREPLGLPGERVWVVPCLSVPGPRVLSEVDQLRTYESIRLFVDRARSAAGGFDLTEQNAPDLARICQQLDGLPLAIELAAARVRHLSPEQLADRLDQRLRLLQTDARQSTPHHQTMRAAIDWSHDLLTPAERMLWRHLSVFSGSFTLSAAETVGSWDGIAPEELLDLLSALIDKSLVTAEEQEGEQRFRLLETLRQYAAEKLCEAGEAGMAGERHRDWYRAFAEEIAPKLSGPEQATWLDRLEREHDNLRAALRWSKDAQAFEELGRIAVALADFWRVRGHLSEATQWLEVAMAVPPSSKLLCARVRMAAGAVLARRGEYAETQRLTREALALYQALGDKEGAATALNLLGQTAEILGDPQSARSYHEESQSIWRELGNDRGIALSLTCLGEAARRRGDYEQAADLYAQCLAIRRRMGHTRGIAHVLNLMGLAAYEQGDCTTARRLYTESLDLWRELKDCGSMALVLTNLGCVAKDLGDYEAAGSHFHESLALNRELKNQPGIALALINLGLLAFCQGDCRQADGLLRESLSAWYRMRDRGFIACCLEGLAAVSAFSGEGIRAARLFGAAEALREAIQTPLPPGDRPDYEQRLSQARQGVDPEAFAQAWAEGRSLPLERAVSEALATGPQPATPPVTAPLPAARPALRPAQQRPAPPPSAQPNPRLNQRETEILRLVSQGVTAKEIGAHLHLSRRTVEKYEEAIRGKLDLPNRTALAAWAVRNGID